jgi:hypothetical protein
MPMVVRIVSARVMCWNPLRILPNRRKAFQSFKGHPMKKLISLMALGLTLGLSVAHAADEKAPTTQQSKMKTCNADAKDKKGDERKAFMKECLSAKPAAAEADKKATPQQEKMKTCNAEAKGLKGDERKKHMSECLKK